MEVNNVINYINKDKILNSFKYVDTRNFTTEISVYLSLTLLIARKLIKEKNLIILNPSVEKLSYVFSYIYTLIDIFNEDLTNIYNNNSLVKGEKYKFQNSIIRFNEIYSFKDRKLIKVELSDESFYSIPIDKAPYFQRVDTNRRLSSPEKFKKDFENWKSNNDSIFAQRLLNLKTYLNQSNVYYSDYKFDDSHLVDFKLNNESLQKLLLKGRMNNGEIKIQDSGQFEGTPGLIFSRDINELHDLLFNQSEISKIFIAFKNNNSIDEKLQYLDLINEMNISNIIFTETLNPEQYKYLKDRNYSILSWNKQLIGVFARQKKIHCQITTDFIAYSESKLNRTIVYFNKIDIAIKTIKSTEKFIENASSDLAKIFDDLVSITFSLIRNYLIKPDVESKLEEISIMLEKSHYTDNLRLIENLKNLLEGIKFLLESHEENGKKNFFSNLSNLKTSADLNTYFLIDNKQDIGVTEKWFFDHGLKLNNHKINIIRLNELDSISYSHSRIYLPFWLNNEKMFKLIYSSKIKEIYLVLYEFEYDWSESFIKKWEKQNQDNNDNVNIFQDLFNLRIKDGLSNNVNYIPKKNEYEIEKILELSKVRRYRDYLDFSEDFIDVIPIELSQNKTFLSAKNHTFLVVSNLTKNATSVTNKKVENLNPGEFIVLRNSQRDLIRDYADKLLNLENNIRLRYMAESWKTPFKNLLVRYTISEIYRMYLSKNGKRHKLSVKNWLTDENMIGPKYYEDILIINDMCHLKTDPLKVHKAIQSVEQYHVKAGFELSRTLEIIIENNSDSDNFIEHLKKNQHKSIFLDGIGEIMLYKVYFISDSIKVPKSKLNSIIEETFDV